MANTADQWHVLIDCYGQHRRPAGAAKGIEERAAARAALGLSAAEMQVSSKTLKTRRKNPAFVNTKIAKTCIEVL